MSVKSKTSNSKDALDRPFAAKVLSKARRLTERYQIVIGFEDGEWYGHALEYPEAIGDGKIFVLDLAECIRIRTGDKGKDAIG